MTPGCELLSTGTIESDDRAILVYPNPFTNSLTIQINDNAFNGEFSLYDMLGKLLIQKKITQNTSVIDVNVLPGMYFYRFVTDTGILKTGKLISK